MTFKKTDLIGGFRKGLQVLAAFSATKPTLTIAETAQITGLDRATARRCLLTLQEAGYANFDGKGFSLNQNACELVHTGIPAKSLSDIVQPALNKLAARIHQSCSVAVLDKQEVIYIARAEQQKIMSITLQVGSRLPAHLTSMGRVLLAPLANKDLSLYLKNCELSKPTIYSKASVSALSQAIRQAKQVGYAAVDQEIEMGLRSLAVPLINQHQQTIAALNIGIAAFHQTIDDMVKEFLPALLETQNELTLCLPKKEVLFASGNVFPK